MQKLKCAVIGVGYLGKFHAEKYTKLQNVELVAVCDADLATAEKIAHTHNVKAYNDPRKLIAENSLDAVSIVSPTSTHFEIAKLFLEHKIHVLLEKPITETIAEADELIAIAKRNQLVLQIGHLERFNPAVNFLKEKLRGNKKPLIIEASRRATFKARCLDVSIVLDLMIHDIDLMHYVIGSKVRKITASGGCLLSPSLDFATARLEFECGSIANLTASRVSPAATRTVNILCRNDAYYCADLNDKVITIASGNFGEASADICKHGCITHHEARSVELATETVTLDKSDALFDEITAFTKSVNEHTPICVTGEDGRAALEIALEIEASAK